jgi:hypothetical protein
MRGLWLALIGALLAVSAAPAAFAGGQILPPPVPFLYGFTEPGFVLKVGNYAPGEICTITKDGTGVAGPSACASISYTVLSGDVPNHQFGLTYTLPSYSAFSITGTPASTGTVGSAYSFTPGVSGGAGSTVFALSGTLCPGLTFTASNGHLGGTPNAPAVCSGLAITGTDAIGVTAALAANPFTITVTSGCAAGKLDFSCASNSGLLDAIR